MIGIVRQLGLALMRGVASQPSRIEPDIHHNQVRLLLCHRRKRLLAVFSFGEFISGIAEEVA